MKNKFPLIFSACFFAYFLSGCVKEEPPFFDGMGKKPVYISGAALHEIKTEPPRPISSSGTIYLQDTLLFILEQGAGIHVFSLKDTANSVNLAFLKIPAATDFVVDQKRLYADSWKDLVEVDISDLANIKELYRVENTINPPLYPLLYDGIFECVDESKGAVVGWEDALLENAQCRTIN